MEYTKDRLTKNIARIHDASTKTDIRIKPTKDGTGKAYKKQFKGEEHHDSKKLIYDVKNWIINGK